MLHKALLSALLASLIGSSVLTGCASPFERYYKPAVTNYGSPVTPPVTPLLVRSRDPVLLWSHDPYGDGELLAQDGYVLIGTSSYDGAIDLSYAQDAAIQGKKVGAAVVLLEVDFSTNQHFLDASDGLNEYVSELPTFGGATGTVFASYWAKAKLRKMRPQPRTPDHSEHGVQSMARDTATPPVGSAE